MLNRIMANWACWTYTIGIYIALAYAENVEYGASKTLTCTIPVTGNDPVYVYKEESDFYMMESAVAIPRMYISNRTEFLPKFKRLSERYSLGLNKDTSQLTLKIDSMSPGDIGVWGCEGGTEDKKSVVMGDLQTVGPLLDLYWVRKAPKEHLQKGRSGHPPTTLKDGAVVTSESLDKGGAIYCVVVATTSAPEMTITYGPPGEEGSTEANRDKNIFYSSTVTSQNISVIYEVKHHLYYTVRLGTMTFFTKDSLYCRASVGSTSLESNLRLRASSAPLKNKNCTGGFRYAQVGSGNLTLSCTIAVYPPPSVTWELPSGEKLTADSEPSIYTVNIKESKQGDLIAELHIDVVENDDFGLYTLLLANSMGKGSMKIHLEEGDEPDSGSSKPVWMTAMMGIVLIYHLLNRLIN